MICLDDYHSLDRFGRKTEGVTALDPKAQNFDLMYEQTKALKEGKPVQKPIYNHVSGLLDAPEEIKSPKVTLRPGLCFALALMPPADTSYAEQRNGNCILHNRVEASSDLMRYPYLGNQLIVREPHALVSYPMTHTSILNSKFAVLHLGMWVKQLKPEVLVGLNIALFIASLLVRR